MTLRCLIDGLLLPAAIYPQEQTIIAQDGDEFFALEALEALYYEVVQATVEEWLVIEACHFRLLRKSADFAWNEESPWC